MMTILLRSLMVCTASVLVSVGWRFDAHKLQSILNSEEAQASLSLSQSSLTPSRTAEEDSIALRSSKQAEARIRLEEHNAGYEGKLTAVVSEVNTSSKKAARRISPDDIARLMSDIQREYYRTAERPAHLTQENLRAIVRLFASGEYVMDLDDEEDGAVEAARAKDPLLMPDDDYVANLPADLIVTPGQFEEFRKMQGKAIDKTVDSTFKTALFGTNTHLDLKMFAFRVMAVFDAGLQLDETWTFERFRQAFGFA